MRRIVVATALLALALVGCSSEHHDNSPVEQTTAPVPVDGYYHDVKNIPGVNSKAYKSADPCRLVSSSTLNRLTNNHSPEFNFSLTARTMDNHRDPGHSRTCEFTSKVTKQAKEWGYPNVSISVSTSLDNANQDYWKALIKAVNMDFAYNEEVDMFYASTLNELTAHKGQVVLTLTNSDQSFDSEVLHNVALSALGKL